MALGAAAAPAIHAGRLGATLAAFLLAVGVSAHAMDELQGRPLRTMLGHGTLLALSVVGLAGAVAIGLAGAIIVSPWLLALVIFGGLAVPAYNLELAGGRWHADWSFALAWGAFPAFTGYFAQTLTVRPAGVLVALACFLASLAQRRLSTPARELRRRTIHVEGGQHLEDGTVVALDETRLAAPLEGALSALWLAFVVLAAGLVITRM